MDAQRYELQPINDGAKSFYGKAIVVKTEDKSELFSYGTKIAEVEVSDGGYVTKIFSAIDDRGIDFTFRSTSLRHLKEFLRQRGLRAENKSQIMKDYKIEEVFI